MSDREQLLRFAAMAIRAMRFEWVGCDWDGGDAQDAMVECGLLEARVVRERCGEDCECARGDTCYFLTPLGLEAVALLDGRAASPSSSSTTTGPATDSLPTTQTDSEETR